MPATALLSKTALVYPRPPIVRDHTQLFQEPAYTDGQPYADHDDEDEALEG
jgi:hypothetical protein